MMILTLVLGVLAIAAVATTITALKQAPEGYEDTEGFHALDSARDHAADSRMGTAISDRTGRPPQRNAKVPAGALLAS